MNDDMIYKDVEVINQVVSLSYTEDIVDEAANYIDEFKTQTCMGALFNAIDDIKQNIEDLVDALKNDTKISSMLSDYPIPVLDTSNVETNQVHIKTKESGSNVNVRLDAGLDYDVVGKVSDGDSVEFTGEIKDGWAQVIINGDKYGYIRSDFINQEELQNYTNQKIETPSQVSSNVEPSNVSKPDDVQIQSRIKTKDTNGIVNVRTSPSIDSQVKMQFDNGKDIIRTGVEMVDDKGYNWYEIIVDGKKLYVCADYVKDIE